MNKAGTLGQGWPLKSGSSTQPTLTPGRRTSFQCNDLPDRSPTGPLAYFVPCLLLTIFGSVTQDTASRGLFREDMGPALIESVDWNNAWHGTVLSGDHFKGSTLPVIEFVSGGFQWGERFFNRIPLANGTYQFACTFALPAADRRGKLLRDTSNLALLFQPSQVNINVADESVLQEITGGGEPSASTWGELTAQLTAVLDPRQELVLGTPPEWILHQISGSSGSAVRINGFGRETRMTGVKEKGGVGFLAELTNVGLQGGAFAAETVSQISFPWRGIAQQENVLAFLNMMIGQLPNDRPQTHVSDDPSSPDDYAGFPWTQSKTSPDPSQTTVSPLNGLRFWPWVLGGDQMRLTMVQSANNDQTYNLTATFDSDAEHMVLAQYFREFEDAKKAAWVAAVTKGDSSSLAAYVLGPDWRKADLLQRFPRDQHVITPDQMAYCPYQLAVKG